MKSLFKQTFIFFIRRLAPSEGYLDQAQMTEVKYCSCPLTCSELHFNLHANDVNELISSLAKVDSLFLMLHIETFVKNLDSKVFASLLVTEKLFFC